MLPPLLPAPKRLAARRGVLRLHPGVPIVLGPGSDDADLASARALRDALSLACGVELAIETHARTADLGPRLELRRDGDRGEAYHIAVDARGAELVGTGAAGLRYAVETLAQLVSASGRIPACRIEDAPDFAFRGVMLDVSRGKVPTAETLRSLVDLAVRLKLNALMLYVEHTFRFRRHPRIGAGWDPLDAETLRDLDAYAAARHVELVPSLQSLGHMDKILRIPAYAHLAETESRFTLAPEAPGSTALLADLYDEYLPNFRSGLFNANCDEPFDLGRGRSAAKARELGAGGLYLEHVRRVRDLAGAQGKRTLIWADVVHAHPERIPEIDRDLVLLDWWYEALHDYDRVRLFAEHGIDFLVCPGTSTWNCLFPRIGNSVENIRRYAAAGRRHGAWGLLVTDWGDFGHANLQGHSWYGYAWAAQQAWSGDTDTRSFDRAFAKRVFGDATGESARLTRELGDVHAAGFAPMNGSPLQFLYFDDLDQAYFVDGARDAELRRSLRRLERLRERLLAAGDRFHRERLTWEETCLAAEASIHACRKALCGRAYLAWRRRPARLDARARRRLAGELEALAREQRLLGARLRRLWLRRSRSAGFELTRRRLDTSIASLRRAARALRTDRPPAPPPPHPGFDAARIFAAALRSAGEGEGKEADASVGRRAASRRRAKTLGPEDDATVGRRAASRRRAKTLGPEARA
jgi:hexosaminidase